MCRNTFYNLFNTFNNWFKYFILTNQNYKNDLFNYTKKTIKTGGPFFIFHKKTKNTNIWNRLALRRYKLLKEIKSTMFKHRRKNIYSKINIKILNCSRCCFYYLYGTFFVSFYCFFHTLLHINMCFLNLHSKRILLSLCRFSAHYKPTALTQY